MLNFSLFLRSHLRSEDHVTSYHACTRVSIISKACCAALITRGAPGSQVLGVSVMSQGLVLALCRNGKASHSVSYRVIFVKKHSTPNHAEIISRKKIELDTSCPPSSIRVRIPPLWYIGRDVITQDQPRSPNAQSPLRP